MLFRSRPLGGTAPSLPLTRSCERAACAQAAFVGRGEVFCPESRYPRHCCSRPRLLPASGTHGDSLVSFFPSPHFGFSSALRLPWRDFRTGRRGTRQILPRSGARPAGEGTEGKWRVGGRRGAGRENTRAGRGGSAPFPRELIGKLIKSRVLQGQYLPTRASTRI